MRKVAFYILNGFAVLAAAFISGYAFEDPGGWVAAAMTAAWVLPTIALGLLAWRYPTQMRTPLIALSAISMIVAASQAVWPHEWRDFLFRTGPVEAIATFGVVFGLNAFARYHDELLGGALMMLVALTPIAAVYFGSGLQRGVLGGSTSAMLLPGVVIGLVYVLDAELHKHAHHDDVSGQVKRGASATG